MRILFLTNLYPPHDIGGYEQSCQEVAIRLEERGHDVRILTSRYGVKSEIDGVENVHTRRSLYLENDLDYYRPLDFFLRRSAREHTNLQELKQTLEEFRPAVVMVWGMWQLSHYLPYWAEHWMPNRVAYYIGSYWPVDADPHSTYWHLPARQFATELLKKPLRSVAFNRLRREGYPPRLQFEHALCCSKYVRDILVKAGKLPSSSGVLYGGIDPNPFMVPPINGNELKKRPLRLLYFGRLIHDKGVHTAIQAIGLLKQHKLADQIELTILGSGHPEYVAQLRNMVADLDLADRVHFIDKVSRSEVPDWLRRFDVFLFTSIWPEPFGRTIVEAMAAGLIVIGSDVGGSQEIFQEGYDSKLLFQPEDYEALADRITQLINDAERRNRLAQLGRQLVLQRFTLRHMVDQIESHLFEIASQD